MKATYLVLLALWFVFLAYWTISAVRAKKNLRTSRSWLVVRLLFVVSFLALLRSSPVFRHLARIRPTNPVFIVAGLLLCGLGLAVAVWARANLGRNWGPAMAVKEGAELVATGPYRYIRHPIYSGILLGIFGSTLVGGFVWLLVFVGSAVYFVFAARQEEQHLIQEFPHEYPEYRKRTKAFLPFVY
jgi:protein-S-isoprenylcysteine O-methyltransferase Ste14